MTYGKYEILADVDTVEQWDIDSDGDLTDWVRDYDSMGNTVYIAYDYKDTLPVFQSSNFDEVKEWCDEH